MTRFIIAPKPYGWWDVRDLKALVGLRLDACREAEEWLIDQGAEYEIDIVRCPIADTFEVVFEVADAKAAVGFQLVFSDYFGGVP